MPQSSAARRLCLVTYELSQDSSAKKKKNNNNNLTHASHHQQKLISNVKPQASYKT